MAVARLCRRVVVAHENIQCRLAETNDANRLKPHQTVSTNTPPQSPEIFNPDPNHCGCPNRRPRISAGPGESLSARIIRRPPHSIPIPAQVCGRRRTRPPLFQRTGRAAAVHAAAIPAGMELPRTNVRLGEIDAAHESAAAQLRFRATDERAGIAARKHAAQIEDLPGFRRAEISAARLIIRRIPCRYRTAGASVSCRGNVTPAA